MKQEALASVLGDDWNQMKVSRLEAKEEIEPKILDQVAKALKIPVEAIKNPDNKAAISIVANTITDFKDNAVASAKNYYPTFNPIDKIVELLEQSNKEKDKEIAALRKEIEKMGKGKM
jgi:hypothetical protein